MPAPTITHAAWGSLNSLTGPIEKFSIAARWSPVAGATDYQVDIVVGASGISDNTLGVSYWTHFADYPVAGDTFKVRAYVSGAWDAYATISLTPTDVAGPASISGNVGGYVFGQFSLGPTLPESWAWAITGAPTGVTITDKGTPTVDSEGGLVSGVATQEGIYEATVAITNYTADVAIFSTQQFPVTFHISGERYIEDFHSTTSRTGINVRHGKGTAASWNLNAQSELDVTLGDSFTLHAILREGTGYLITGITNLRLVAKLPARRDGPAILTATAPAPVADTFGSVTAWPLTFAVESDRARRLFDAANTPTGAATESASILLAAQISYTYGGRAYRSLPFPIRLAQPISQL